MNHLKTLNEAQKKAVLQTEGPVLILAGAGAGKTKTLTHRILHLIKQGTPPHQVLAITFTNKAAKEMRERVFSLIKEDKELNLPISFNERPFISTFHALGAHILRENSRILDIPRTFSIFDRNESRKVIKDAIESIGLDSKQYDPNVVLSVISKEKGNGVTLAEFRNRGSGDYFGDIVLSVWEKYKKTLLQEKALDFDDLLLSTAELLRKNEVVKAKYNSIWKYIHVDEYQDTNKVQYTIMKMLVGNTNNICVVGDIDQNIYSWRGADIKNMLNFEKDFRGAKTITLEENYRSTSTILSVANDIIKKNKNRFEKNLFTRQGAGEKMGVYEAYDETDEARFVAVKTQELIGKGVPPQEIAVLYRANFQSRALEEAFMTLGLPYQVLGVKFFDRKEIKDVLSFVRASLNPDSLSDIKRIINVPPRGIGKATIAKIFSGFENSLSSAHKIKWISFKELLAKIRDEAKESPPSLLIKFVLKQTKIEEIFHSKTEEDMERLENLRELVTFATKYDGLPLRQGIEKLLEDVALQSDQDEMEEERNATRLMTVHASKGLEFDCVFITGLEQDLFPHKAMAPKKSGRDDEEERRLFYVALTRARKKVYLSYANIRMIFGSRQVSAPSEFLLDIDEKYIHQEEKVADGGKVIYFDL